MLIAAGPPVGEPQSRPMRARSRGCVKSPGDSNHRLRIRCGNCTTTSTPTPSGFQTHGRFVFIGRRARWRSLSGTSRRIVSQPACRSAKSTGCVCPRRPREEQELPMRRRVDDGRSVSPSMRTESLPTYRRPLGARCRRSCRAPCLPETFGFALPSSAPMEQTVGKENPKLRPFRRAAGDVHRDRCATDDHRLARRAVTPFGAPSRAGA